MMNELSIHGQSPFDDIGNRKTAAAGGDASGQNLRQQRYTANLLNQYTERRNPQSFGILGSANADATVTVWGPDGAHARAIRQGEHFYGELAVSNYPGPVWLKTTNTAFMSVNDAEIWTNTTGKALVPPTPQVYTHDLDGNLTADGLWTRTWNAENRVLTVESVSSLPAEAKKREAWTYLPDGRWIERIVSTNNGSAYYPALTNRYVWDGQVLLAILDHSNGLVMSFMRGLDLSGSMQGAGGVGGVLAVSFAPSTLNPQPSTHFVSYDGNGNVAGLTDAATGASTARFEYGPFGELQRSSGLMANIMPLRFSTMYSDDVTGDVKYLFRDYRAEEGRWLSRDPLGEDSFLQGLLRTLMQREKWRKGELLQRESLGPEEVFVRNDPLAGYDALGLKRGQDSPVSVTIPDCSIGIYAGDGLGYGWFDEEGNWLNPDRKADAFSNYINVPVWYDGNPDKAAVAVIACNAKWFVRSKVPIINDLPDSRWTVQQAINEIDPVLGRATAYARDTLCKSCKCAYITINVTCTDPIGKPGLFGKPGSPHCGTSVKVKCPETTKAGNK